MRAEDLVSVVIPCYRQAHFLGDAVESALAQTHPHVEVIVVDDGSPDDTAAVAARYRGVRYLRKPNGGLSSARNAGLAASAGAFLVFLDADDRLLPNAVADGLARLAERPDCAFTCGRFRYVDASGAPLEELPEPDGGPDPYLAFLRHNYVTMHATVLYRRRVFEEVGRFDTARAACEDYDLYLRVARRFPVCSHGGLVAEYRRHDENMSDVPELMLRTSLAVLRAQRPYVAGNPLYEAALDRAIAAWREDLGERVVARIRASAAARRWVAAAGRSAILMWYNPLQLVRHGGRKLRATLSRTPKRLLARRRI